MRKSPFVVLLALSGCATILTTEQAEAEIHKFNGRPVSALILRMGNQFQEAPNGRRYTWQYTNVVGYVRGFCTLEAVVDEARIIRGISMDGNRGGCYGVAKRAGDLE